MFQVRLEAVQACEKKNFSELEKLIFCKDSVFSKSLGKTMFQVPKSTHILILCGLDAVQACAKKTLFGALEIVFLQSPVSSHTVRPYKGARL